MKFLSLLEGGFISGTSNTGAGTTAKTVTMADVAYIPRAGDFLVVTFTNGNSASAMTLAVNADSARNIRFNGADASITTATLNAGAVLFLYFDGTYYQMIGSQRTTGFEPYLNKIGSGFYLDNGSNRPTLGNNAVDLSYSTDGINGAIGDNSFCEGLHTLAKNSCSHAEGDRTAALTPAAHAEGKYTLAAQGTLYTINNYNNTNKTITLDKVSGLSIGDLLQIKIYEGENIYNVPIANINGLTVTLNTTQTINDSWIYAIKLSSYQIPVHAEGHSTTASGSMSHAEGTHTLASGHSSHAEGSEVAARGSCSHAEGDGTLALGQAAHTEGMYNVASGMASHAEGWFTEASGIGSHAAGYYTIAAGQNQTVIGSCNIPDTTSLFIIGNSNDENEHSNALTVDMSGNMVLAGNLTAPNVLTTNNTTEFIPDSDYEPATKKYVDDRMPVGALLIWSSNTAPGGYLLCDGSAISRTTYADLFATIGTTYGSGNGSSTFNLPNLKGKFPVGRDSSQTEFDTLAETGGEKTHTLTESEIPAHSHTLKAYSDGDGGYSTPTSHILAVISNGWAPAADADSSTAPSNTTGGGAAHNNLQPYIVLNYIIKY